MQVPLEAEGVGVMKDCICWEWRGEARDEGDAAAAWFSSFLNMDVRLVRYAGVLSPSVVTLSHCGKKIYDNFLVSVCFTCH